MNQDIYGIVYKVTNLIDGNIYIGQTVQSLWRRRRAHENLSCRPSTYFHRALAKHGFANFTWDIVESCSTKDCLHEREQFWIDHFACMAPAGYNSAEGGKGGAYLESHKQRISIAMTGRKLSAETRQKLGLAHRGKKLSPAHIAALKGKTGENNHFFGRTHSEETRRLIGEKSKGRSWATGEKAGSWANADRGIILESYFQKCTEKQMISIHLEKTGRKIGRKALARVFEELGLHVSTSRGKKAAIERTKFIDANDISDFYIRLEAITRASDESASGSLQISLSTLSHLQSHQDSSP
jgi:group I intron endonuclease